MRSILAPTRRCACIALLLALTGVSATAQDWPSLPDGTVVLLRHANAPGGGDPPGFKLRDCSTQRNLDETGRAQARRIGEQFRARGVRIGAVLTSQWCRTKETADLAFPALAREDPAFNSFFGAPERGPAQTAAALARLAAWRGPGVLVVITHQRNIIGLTGEGPASGEGVVVRPKAGGVEVLARIAP